MSGTGKALREAREAQGISLAEMHRRTQIREWIIEALETENFKVIPGGGAYLRGFVRRLCRELNLDFEQVYSVPNPGGQNIEASVPPVKLKEGRRANLWSVTGLILMFFAVFASAAYWFLIASKPISEPPVVAPPQVVEPPPVQPDPPLPPIERPAFVFAGEEQGALIFVVDKWPMELVVTVREEQCWVLINADTQGGRSLTLRAGQTMTTTANDSLRMRLGRARVVDISVNGHFLPRRAEDVKDFVFRKAGP